MSAPQVAGASASAAVPAERRGHAVARRSARPLHTLVLVLAAVCGAALASCGQRGPLVLPSATPSTAPSATASTSGNAGASGDAGPSDTEDDEDGEDDERDER